MTSDSHGQLRRILVQRLESLAAAGVRALPVPRPESQLLPTAAPAAPPAAHVEMRSPVVKERKSMPKTSGRWAAHSNTLFEAEAATPPSVSTAPSLEVLQQEVAGCTRCDELARTRTQTVFGVGNPNARLCFLGEAPGADEDRLGEPFVGRAGQLLDKIIEACKMKREDVYICNVLKCRPPGNRNPLPEEAAKCRRFLDCQLDLVQPEFICCLGAVAAQSLLSTPVSIGKLRGKLHAYRGAKVVCTYHPAYLLRNPAAKKDTWEDMKFLLREMGVEL